MCHNFTCEKAIHPINFAYSVLHMWKCNQSSPRVEWLGQILKWLPRSVVLKSAPACSLCFKNMALLPVLVHFRKQQQNTSNILIISTSASANSHLSKSYLCFKGEHSRRNIQHFYTQRKSTESESVFAQREAPSWKRFHTLCFEYEFPV